MSVSIIRPCLCTCASITSENLKRINARGERHKRQEPSSVRRGFGGFVPQLPSVLYPWVVFNRIYESAVSNMSLSSLLSDVAFSIALYICIGLSRRRSLGLLAQICVGWTTRRNSLQRDKRVTPHRCCTTACQKHSSPYSS